MEHVTFKTIVGIAAGLGAFLLDKINGPILVLLIFMILDYITGMATCLTTDKAFDSKAAVRGIIKKLGYGILIIAAMLMDYVLFQQGSIIGIEIKIAMLTIAITLYLIGTEGFSIMQNLILIGVPVPDFMLKVFNLVKNESGGIVKFLKE